jgi:hypothetical protein
MLALSSISTFLISKRPDIGIFYLVLVVFTLVGQFLTGRGLFSTIMNEF